MPILPHDPPDDEPWFQFDITPPANLTRDDFYLDDITRVTRIDFHLTSYLARICVSALILLLAGKGVVHE
jgi:hypothetical protein